MNKLARFNGYGIEDEEKQQGLDDTTDNAEPSENNEEPPVDAPVEDIDTSDVPMDAGDSEEDKEKKIKIEIEIAQEQISNAFNSIDAMFATKDVLQNSLRNGGVDAPTRNIAKISVEQIAKHMNLELNSVASLERYGYPLDNFGATRVSIETIGESIRKAVQWLLDKIKAFVNWLFGKKDIVEKTEANVSKVRTKNIKAGVKAIKKKATPQQAAEAEKLSSEADEVLNKEKDVKTKNKKLKEIDVKVEQIKKKSNMMDLPWSFVPQIETEYATSHFIKSVCNVKSCRFKSTSEYINCVKTLVNSYVNFDAKIIATKNTSEADAILLVYSKIANSVDEEKNMDDFIININCGTRLPMEHLDTVEGIALSIEKDSKAFKVRSVKSLKECQIKTEEIVKVINDGNDADAKKRLAAISKHVIVIKQYIKAFDELARVLYNGLHSISTYVDQHKDN